MNKDIGIIKLILEYIESIIRTQNRFGNDASIFSSDRDYFNSVCMNLLQIGELSHHLTSEFIKSHTDIPWKNIVGLRNVVVHGYGQLDIETVWATVISDLPDLRLKCMAIINSGI